MGCPVDRKFLEADIPAVRELQENLRQEMIRPLEDALRHRNAGRCHVAKRSDVTGKALFVDGEGLFLYMEGAMAVKKDIRAAIREDHRGCGDAVDPVKARCDLRVEGGILIEVDVAPVLEAKLHVGAKPDGARSPAAGRYHDGAAIHRQRIDRSLNRIPTARLIVTPNLHLKMKPFRNRLSGPAP